MIAKSSAGSGRAASRLWRPVKLEGRDIVCIGTADWATELPINQHQLMRRLAARNRVLFVESLGLRRPQLASRDLRRIASPAGARPARRPPGGAAARALAARAALSRQRRTALAQPPPAAPPGPPGGAAARDGQADPLGLCPAGGGSARRCSTPSWSSTTASTTSPLRRGSMPRASGPPRSASRGGRTSSSPAPRRSPSVCARSRGNVLYAPNVADTELFATALEAGPVDPFVDALPRPRLVFQGAIVATKLDVGLLAELAALRPNGASSSSGRAARATPAAISPRWRRPPTSTSPGRARRRACRPFCVAPTPA